MSGGHYTGIATLLRSPDGQTVPIYLLQSLIRNQRANASIVGSSQDGSDSPYLTEAEEAAVVQRLNQISGYISYAESDPMYGGTDGFGASFDSAAGWDIGIFQESLRRGVETIIRSMPLDYSNPGQLNPNDPKSLALLSRQSQSIPRVVAALQDAYINAVESQSIRKPSIDYNSAQPIASYPVGNGTGVIHQAHDNQVPTTVYTPQSENNLGAQPTQMSYVPFHKSTGVLFPARGEPNAVFDVDEAHGGSFLDTSDQQPRAHKSAGQQFADDILTKTFQATEALKSKGSFRSDSGSGMKWPKSLTRKKSKKKLTRAISNPHLVSTTQRLDNTVDLSALAQNPNLVKLQHKPSADESETTINSAQTMPATLRSGIDSPDPNATANSSYTGLNAFAPEGRSFDYSGPTQVDSGSSATSSYYHAPVSSVPTSASSTLPPYLLSTMYPASETAIPVETPMTSPMEATMAPQLLSQTATNNEQIRHPPQQVSPQPVVSQPVAPQSVTPPTATAPENAEDQVYAGTIVTDYPEPAAPNVPEPPKLGAPEPAQSSAPESVKPDVTRASLDRDTGAEDSGMSQDPETLLQQLGFMSVPITARQDPPRAERVSVAESNASEEPVQGNRTANLLAQLVGQQQVPPPIVRPRRPRGSETAYNQPVDNTDASHNKHTSDRMLSQDMSQYEHHNDVISFSSKNDPMASPNSVANGSLLTPTKQSAVGRTSVARVNVRNSSASSLYDMYIGGMCFRTNADDLEPSSVRKTMVSPRGRTDLMRSSSSPVKSTRGLQTGHGSMLQSGSSPVWQIVAGLNDRASIVSVGDGAPRATRQSTLSMLSEREEPGAEVAPAVPDLFSNEQRDFFKRARAKPLEDFDFQMPVAQTSHTPEQQLSDVMSSLNLEPEVNAMQGKGVLVCRDGDSEPTNIVYKDEEEIPIIMDEFAQGNSAARFEFHRLSRFTGKLEEFVPSFGKLDSDADEDVAGVEQRIVALLRPGDAN